MIGHVDASDFRSRCASSEPRPFDCACAGPHCGYDLWDRLYTTGSDNVLIGHESWILVYCRCGNAEGFFVSVSGKEVASQDLNRRDLGTNDTRTMETVAAEASWYGG